LLAQQKSKELQFECQKCQSRHAIKEVLRWPINTVLENYLKGLAAQEDNPQKVSNSKSALLDEEDDPNARKICERCEDQKPKVVCYDCGVFGTALCKECSALIHARGSFTKHKVSFSFYSRLLFSDRKSLKVAISKRKEAPTMLPSCVESMLMQSLTNSA